MNGIENKTQRRLTHVTKQRRLRASNGQYLEWVGTGAETKIRKAKDLFFAMLVADRGSRYMESKMLKTREEFRSYMKENFKHIACNQKFSNSQNLEREEARWAAFCDIILRDMQADRGT